jgi:hypothetical protein
VTTILVDGVATEVGAAPLTLLCHKGDVRLDPDGQVEIGAEQTLERARRVTPEEWAYLRVHPIFCKMFGFVFPTMEMPLRLHREGTGVQHVTGMILLLIELEPDQKPFLRFPESFLHPSAQSGLANLFAYLASPKPAAP